MKEYANCPLKRAIQSALFPEKANIILGLSSPRIEASYISVLPKHKDLFLVNYEPEDDVINANSLIGLFDLLLQKKIYPDFIDADFCNTIWGSGADLLYLYQKCSRFKKDVIISYTFSVRDVGLDKTMKWLESFPNVQMGQQLKVFEELWQPRQFAYQYGECIHYRESGDNMISGIIKLSKNENNNFDFNKTWQ